MTDLEKLLKRIERYMRDNDVSASDFGRLARGNSALVSRLREGNVLLKTIRNVNAWLDKKGAP